MVWTVFLIPIVTIIAVFTFVSITVWAENRRKERAEYHRHETYQKMLEGPAGGAETVRQLIREDEARRERRRKQGLELGLKMGGLITLVAGLGLAVFLLALVDDEPVYLVGLIPVLVGLVLTVFGFLVKVPPEASESS